jgi:LPS export ABC transporter protein LptC
MAQLTKSEVGLMKVQKSDSKYYLLVKKLGIAVLFLGTAILFYACENNDLAKIKTFDTLENLPIQEATNFETFYTDSGRVRFTLKAPLLLRYENEGQSYLEFPNGMELVKYDANQKITSSIRADYARQDLKDELWEAKNNVVVTNIQGDSLETEHLIWETKTEKIHTEEFVKIIRKDQVITGIGLTSDQDMLNWKIKNPKGVLYVTVNKEEEPQPATPDPNVDQTPVLPEPPVDTGKVLQFK